MKEVITEVEERLEVLTAAFTRLTIYLLNEGKSAEEVAAIANGESCNCSLCQQGGQGELN